MNQSQKPLLRGVVHLVGFFIAILAVYFLLRKNNELWIYNLIYSVSLLMLLGISTIYHKLNWSPRIRSILQKFDHAAIVFLIAGTSTPLIASATSYGLRFFLLIIYWILISLAILKIFSVPRKSKLSSVLFYVTIALLPFIMFLFVDGTLEHRTIELLLLGGGLYILGSIFYAFKKPNLFQNIFGYHEIFHTFVLFGAATHYLAIYKIDT